MGRVNNKQTKMMLSDCIPAEIWTEVVMEMLDTRDLAALGIAYGPDATIAAWADLAAANAAATAAQFTAFAAVTAAAAAQETARALAAHAVAVDAANPSLAFSASLSARAAVFRAKRVLSDEELQWFVNNRITVVPISECKTVEFNQRKAYPILWHNCNAAQFFPARVWLVNGILHGCGDLPAVECASGDRFWLRNGEIHRDDDLPAVEYANGDRLWFVHGVLHRDNARPAVEYANGRREWWVRGKRQYRDDLA